MAYYPYATVIDDIYTLTNAGNGAVAVFNDQLHPLYAGTLTEVTGLDSPEVRESAEELAQADGGSHGYFFFGRRPITLTARYFGHADVAERTERMDRARRASLAMRSDAVLSWKPATYLDNLLKNPSATINHTDGGWALTQTSSGATFARGTSPAGVSEAGQWTITNGVNGANNINLRNSGSRFPVIPGRTYTKSAYFRSDAVPRTARVYIDFYDSVGSRCGGSPGSGTPITTTTSGWTRAYAQAPAPFNAVMGQIIVQFDSVGANEIHYIDAMMVNEGLLTIYQDGTSAGWFWQGDPHNSASGNYLDMFTYVRRQGPVRETGQWVKEMQLPLISEFAAIYSVGQKTLTAAAGVNLFAENRGSWPATPIFRIIGPISVTNPTINQVQGGSGVINTTGSLLVASGETLEIDTLNHTATFTAGPRTAGGVGNANSFINFATTVWPVIPSTGTAGFGTSGFHVTGTTGSLQAVWRDTWM